MVGKTDEYGNQVLDLPDEEDGDVLGSEPRLIYFPDEGNFQLSGLGASYTNITKRQARQMVDFINQVLGEESSDDRLSTWQVADIIQLVDQDLQEHFQDRFDPHQAVYLLGDDGAVTEDDWRQVMSAYPPGADLAYLLIMNELSTTTEIASIPVKTWPWILKAKLDDPDVELEHVFYTQADSDGII